MSDFGAAIIISKKDKTTISAEEKTSIIAGLEEVQQLGEFTDMLGEDFLFKVTDTAENTYVFVVLSQYWYGKGNDEENFETAQENDLAQAEEVATLLESPIGDVFVIESAFENW